MRGQLFILWRHWLVRHWLVRCWLVACWLIVCWLTVSCGQPKSDSPAVSDPATSATTGNPAASSSTSSTSNSADYALAHIAYDYLVPQGSTPADILAASEEPAVSGSLADFAGHPLVINFWASWCPPCITEMPEFERVYQDYQGQVAFLGINVQDEPADALELALATGVSYPLALDPLADIQLELRIISTPATLFVSPSGEVLDTWQGILDEAGLVSRIQSNFGMGNP